MAPEPTEVVLPNQVTLSYVDQGDRSAPPVVLLHGLRDSWRSFEPVLSRLPHSVRAIAPSQRGHGDSEKPDADYRPLDFASDVEALLDLLELPRAVIVGHSSHGLVAQRFAIDNPGRTTGIVLEGSFATLRGDEALDDIASKISVLSDPIDPDFVREFQGGTVALPLSESFMDAVVQETLKVPARVWRAAFEAVLQEDHTPELGAIAVPTLMIWGERDSVIDRDKQDVLVAGIPDSELVVYLGVGHTPHWEEPQRFATDLVSFVRRVVERRPS